MLKEFLKGGGLGGKQVSKACAQRVIQGTVECHVIDCLNAIATMGAQALLAWQLLPAARLLAAPV